jgi:2,3-bisphosphoglycerate-dependent phosphoglycerate mutase
MKKAIFLSKSFRLMLIILLLSNFSAFAQKTTIWIVNHAEKARKSDALSDTGQQRATDLMKTLKHENVEVIYVTAQNISAQTASPLAARDKILPRVYTDSVQKFVGIIQKNFIGKNVLIIADSNTIIPFISAFGANSPFDALDKGDYDQLFTITIKASGDVECAVRYYGKSHHVNAIPQSYILDNFSPGLPGH